MGLFSLLRQIRTAAATAWMSYFHSGPGALPAPPLDQIVVQEWGTGWCGPAAATNAERMLTGHPGALEDARRPAPAGILNTWPGGRTSVEALVGWLTRRGLRPATLYYPTTGVWEAVDVAASGGALSILLIWTDGIPPKPGGADGFTHFVVCRGLDAEERLLLVDSLGRGVGGEEHLWSIPRADLRRWIVPVNRFGALTPVIVVRRS